MAAIFFRPWRFFRCFLLCFSGSKLALAEGLFQQPLSDAQEAFGRRSCKFRPLPSNLSEGYVTPEGAYEVAETFGVPLAVLVGAGHRLQATVPDVALMGFTVQLPFHGSVQVVVEATVGQRTLKCTHTWGAGGHMKQCGLTRIQLPPGPVTLTFRATGLGVGVSTGEPGACLTLRLDLEISSHKASESARMCFQSALPAAAPPLLSVSGSGDASIPVTTFSSPAPNGVIWKAALPAAQANNFNRLFARVTFPSMVHPVRLLIEELKPWTSIGDEPKCLRRCFTGTAAAHGQVLQRLLPPAMPFALWILSDDHDGSGIAGGHCANYDFELHIGPVPMSSMAQDFLGPAAWLCEGGAWPRRLEQSTDGIFMTEQVLRQRRFALRDHFDLTRPPDLSTSPASPGSLGGLHAIEIQVSEASIFRLTTHAPTVPARPVLVPGRQDEAWLALSNPNNEILTRRIPAAGREFRHSISTELSPGEYTLLFVLEMPTGGLRPCASLLLNLLLEPLVAAAVQSCASDAGNGILDLQAMAEPLPVTAWRPLANSFTVTLPRPVGSFEEGAGDAQGLQIIARSSMNLGYSATDPSAPPVMLHAKVTSPFSTADLQVTFYENGQPLGEPIPLADGNGYRAMAGPVVKDAFYEVMLFHVPRTPSSRTHCVDFDVELAAVSLTPPTAQGQFIAPLPGAENCWSGDQLPAVIRVREGESTVLEGNFQLPTDGHRIQFIASSAVLLRVSVSSRDAEVRVGQEPLQFLGLAEDRFFHRGPAGTLSIRTRSTGRAEHLCPVLRMHLVVVQESAVEDCSRVAALGSLQALGNSLESALLEQSSDSAQLKRVAAQLSPDVSQAATVPLKVLSVSAELRVELAIEAPWLPLELVLFRDGQEEKAWASAHFAGQRLVMLLPSLPKGQYQLKLSYWSPAGTGAAQAAQRHCAALLGTVALLAAKGRDTSNYRQEMLDLPELLSVRPPPNPLLPGWFRAQQELLSSEIYTVPAGGSVSSQLQLQSPCIFRVVAEPTDILAPRLSLELKGGDATTGSVSTAATGSGFVQQLPAGTYELIFKSDDQALADAVPFFVTWGIRATSADTGAVSCDGLARMEDATVGTARQGSAKEFKKQLNIAALPNALKLPVTVPQPAVATIASWSPFTQHYVRVALVSDEGLWVGEQRGRRSSLEIELPPGDYQMTVEEMSPLSPPAGCMAMGVAVSLVPFSAIERSSSAVGSVPPFLGSSLGLGARCDGLGALPLPLDAISDTGGSAAYGGPVDADGRLLIRERIMLTDIHDGRKKVFLRLPAASMLRVAVVSEDAMETEVVLEDSSHQQIAPVESHIMGEGQAASYIMEAPASGLWVSFHREHRVAQTSGCASFDLLMQSAPMQDMVKMSACGEPRELREMVEKVLEHFHESTISSAEGRLRIPGTTSGSGSASTGALHLRLAEESLVEVEVQFNFMLSNVHLWLDSGLGRGLAPRVRAHGTAAAEKNAAAQLRLRLDAGDHVVRIRHDPAFPAEASPIKLLVASPQCAPLSLKLRRVAVRAQRPVVSMPMAPLVSGSDLVLHLGSSGSIGSSAALAQKPPSAASQGGGGHTLAWSSQALSGLLGVSGRQVSPAAEGVSQIWALPLRLENGGGEGEVWFALERRKTGQPWTGDAVAAAARSAPATLWPADEPLTAATNSAVLSVPVAAAAPTALPPLMPAVGMLSVPDEPKHEKSAGILSTSGMFCWLVVLCLLAYYLHVVQPVWFVHFMRKSQTMLAMVHGVHGSEREHHFGQFEAAAEMTNPWSWPTTIPSRAAPRVPRSTRMYGTLDL